MAFLPNICGTVIKKRELKYFHDVIKGRTGTSWWIVILGNSGSDLWKPGGGDGEWAEILSGST